MNDRQSLPWTRHLSADLVAVTNLMESGQSAHLGFVDTIVRAAVARNQFVASALVMLGVRALNNSSVATPEPATLHAFAAAMELIVLSLDGHANLPDKSDANPDEPLLSLGPAIGVLLGDLLYTRAFRLIVHTGHERGLAEVASITEKMVLGATSERFPEASGAATMERATLLTASYAGCASLAALLGGATVEQHRRLESFGEMCGRLQGGSGETALVESVKALAGEIFQPSAFRDDLFTLVDFLGTTPTQSHA